ncbi:SGNH/GDSL hydrolase family protein [Actinomycetes bacterium M1A6_2h]
MTFDYRNRTGRGPGRAVRALGAVVPGVARVWAQSEPYADAWHARNLTALDETGRRWFVLGDSLSQGIGASSYDAGWVGQLDRRLAARDYSLRIVNLSATGARVRDVLDQQLPVLNSIGTRDDDVISVMVGSNDLFGGRRDRLGGDFAELVEAVPAGTVVTTLPQPTRATNGANAAIERAAAAGRIVMADLRETGPSSWRGRLAGDWFHPNDAGYHAIATALEPSLITALGRT